MPAKVVVRDLSKRYGLVEAARGVSFDVEDGEIFGLLGPNGAGKTTTVECLLGLRQPDEGAISICGIDARREPREVKQHIGAALQTTALQDKITPREALGLFASFYRVSLPPDTLLHRFALSEKADAPFDTLSGGQRQRLALALAFINDPELVFLDEPTTGLDAQSRRELHAEIRRMKEDGHTVLLTTHHLEEAEQLCDRIAIIAEGRIIETGAPRDLIARSTRLQTVHLTTSARLDETVMDGLPDVSDLSQENMTLRFRTPAASRTIADLMQRLLAQGVEITELHVQKASLEDVYLERIATEGARDPHATSTGVSRQP
ncbi:MAG: ABC transporter ATP-binding protein [Vicinamibacterales bacterium]